MSGVKHDQNKPLYALTPFSYVTEEPTLLLLEDFLRRKISPIAFTSQAIKLLNIENPELAVTQVLTFGANKYDNFNWEKGLAVTRLLSAFGRHCHLYPKVYNECVDQESGFPHEWHALCCAVMAAWTVENKPDFDDRPEGA